MNKQTATASSQIHKCNSMAFVSCCCLLLTKYIIIYVIIKAIIKHDILFDFVL